MQPPELLLASARAALPHLRSAQPLAARPIATLFNNWGVLCELALPEGGCALALLPLGNADSTLRRRVSQDATSALLAEQVQVGHMGGRCALLAWLHTARVAQLAPALGPMAVAGCPGAAATKQRSWRLLSSCCLPLLPVAPLTPQVHVSSVDEARGLVVLVQSSARTRLLLQEGAWHDSSGSSSAWLPNQVGSSSCWC